MKGIKQKMIFSIGAMLLVMFVGLTMLFNKISSDSLLRISDNALKNLASQGAETVSAKVDSVLNELEAVAERELIKDVNIPWEIKKPLLKEIMEKEGHIRMGFSDLKGNMQTTVGTSVDISDRPFFISAVNGQSAVSDPTVAMGNGIILINYAVPVYNGTNVIAVLVATRDGGHLSEITNEITFGESGRAFMINEQGTTVAHSNRDLVINMDNDFENEKTDPQLTQLVELEKKMVAGESGVGNYSYNGVAKIMGYAPVKGTSWSLALTAPREEVLSELINMNKNVLIMAIFFIILGIVITYIIAAMIAKPIVSVSNQLKIIAEGDFSAKIPDKLTKGKDEIGLLARSAASMSETIRAAVRGVVTESNNVAEAASDTNTLINDLNSEVEDVLATTEQLSAGMEETAASAEEMNAASLEIDSAVEDIAKKAQECSAAIGQISVKANSLKKSFIESQQAGSEKFEKIKEDLDIALEDSKAVKQIHSLADSILHITSQTNLLSLNAAIEAARAGEAGKGFAVVADQIGKLAEDSKESVTKIQQITSNVLAAVENLSKCSGGMMQFFMTNVTKDYGMMLNTVDDYGKDADMMNATIMDFSATSEQLSASIQNMLKAINDVATASGEGAEGTSNISEKISIVAIKASQVLAKAEATTTGSEHLKNIMSRFKV